MASEFKIHDMGTPSVFSLGIETIPDHSGLLLSQQRYMKDILKRASMVDCKALTIPVSLSRADDSLEVLHADPTQYCSLAGALHKASFVDIHAFSNSDWVSNPDDRKSTNDFAVFLGNNLVSWTCRKQRAMAHSSTKLSTRHWLMCLQR
ncbi:uncharacterized protein LOC116015985 [Ipomoea triloba]|uniref:uncharacterized protein LOC116015985 n=1 Tax=Ipomoea triloba TaxID=35885 RepID=UPI00125D7B95|nr:uncharacterized protein LOC116015985 [Ipomoea triloba]